MNRFILLLGLLLATPAFGDAATNEVTVQLESVSVYGPRTNTWFFCNVRVDNQTDTTLSVTNLFVLAPGLGLKISDSNGKELKKTYAAPFHSWKWNFAPHSGQHYRLMYGVPSPTGGYNVPGIPLPSSAHALRVQIEGTMSGSSYTGSITSNVVEVRLPN